MHILCIGINHTTAPLELREKLAFSEEKTRYCIARFVDDNDGKPRNISEMVIISTCNRIELYAVSPQAEFSELESFLATLHGMLVEDFESHLYRYCNEQAVNHLYRVTTGLDSLVLGEPQILGQVTRSLEMALNAGTCGAVLSRLFRTAIHAGKRARSETSINRYPASVSSLAASLAAREVKNLQDAKVLVVGAGEMAELAVEALRKRGVIQIAVVNRTLERAQLLASRWQAQAFTFKHIEALFQQSDIVISSTSAPHAIIKTPQMAEIMRGRAHRVLVMIDIAVPRNIDPEVSQIPGIKLFDLDSLDCQVHHLHTERAAEVPQVEAILREEIILFMEYWQTLDMLPIISEIRRQAEAIRMVELERTLRRLPELTEVERARIDAMTRSLVKKLMHTPTQRLRTEANCPHASQYMTVARTLFDLTDEVEVCAFSGQKCPIPHTTSNHRQLNPNQADHYGD